MTHLSENLASFIRRIPKAELHLHIEGTFEPELMFEIAQRNGIEMKYSSIESLKSAYEFNNLQEFLDIYYEGAGVLINERDFYDLTMDYMRRLSEQEVRHIELFFDPQTHTERGISFDTCITGIIKALDDAQEKWNISSELIMCFLRHLSEEDAMKTLEQAMPFQKHIIGVGLDSSEVGNPPTKFKNVFEKARQAGFKIVAHAGEEGPSEYIWEAIDILQVHRVDHGNRCLDDEQLVGELVKRKIPLTVCPLSNLKLCVVDDLREHPVKRMLDVGLMVTINSDDPAYFGGGVNANYLDLAGALNLQEEDIRQLAKNSFQASFLSDKEKQNWMEIIDQFE